MENNSNIPIEQNKMSFRYAILCKGHQKGLTAEQKTRLQRHAPTCKYKSPSLSLDLWFSQSVVRSATEPFPANLSPWKKNFSIFFTCSNLNRYVPCTCLLNQCQEKAPLLSLCTETSCLNLLKNIFMYKHIFYARTNCTQDHLFIYL